MSFLLNFSSISKIFLTVTLIVSFSFFVLCSGNGKKSFSSRHVIGIDLGTTYSCVGLMKDDGKTLEILSNEFGSRITPSFVSFNDQGERFIGEDAMRQVITNPRNTIFDVKRFIGRNWLDPFVQEIKSNYPFEILESDNGKVVFEIRTKTIRRFFTPEEISGMILEKMKLIAEDYLGEKVEDAVITVPAYFNDAQRSATRDAGAIAGLNVLRILNEPTAAALAYGFGIKDNKGNQRQNIIVYDLGGGTFDVSLLKIKGGSVEVLSTTGDTSLGGRDFDNNVVDYLIRHYIREAGVIEVREDVKSIEKLRLEVEKAKRVLTAYKSTKIEIDSFHNGLYYSATLTRDKFNELNIELFKSTLRKLNQVLEDAELKIKDIDEIVLVGGSTRIPMIQQLVREYFNGKSPKRDINPDEAVVSGAVVQAFMLTNSKGSEKMDLLDVVPLSLGLEVKGGIFDKIVNRNTQIPFRATADYTTTVDNQKSVEFKIFEGERSLTQDNNLLGSFVFDGIEPGRRGSPNIEVTIDINANGIVKVTAKNTNSYKSTTHTLSNDQRLSTNDIDRMIVDAKKFSARDAERREGIKARNSLEEFIMQIRDIINSEDEENDENLHLTYEQKSILSEAVDKISKWLENNLQKSKDEYTKVQKDIETHVSRFLRNIGMQVYGNKLREFVNRTEAQYEKQERDEL